MVKDEVNKGYSMSDGQYNVSGLNYAYSKIKENYLRKSK